MLCNRKDYIEEMEEIIIGKREALTRRGEGFSCDVKDDAH